MYANPLALRSFCTSATSCATDTLPVPTWLVVCQGSMLYTIIMGLGLQE